jgi:hypothetical protein
MLNWDAVDSQAQHAAAVKTFLSGGGDKAAGHAR